MRGVTHDLPALLGRLGVPFRALGAPERGHFARVAALEDADPSSLVFVAKPGDATLDALRATPASVALVEEAWGLEHEAALSGLRVGVFLVGRPRAVVAAVVSEVLPDELASSAGVHPTALVDPRAELHPSVVVGPYAVIGRCRIGEGSYVGAHSVIKDDVELGRRVIIREHCLLGGAGFGFAKDEGGRWLRIPHAGKLVVEDDVEVFPFANLDRGTFGETRVGRGTKIDHYVHVGHNARIGEDCVLTAGTVLCGSSRIGARTWTGVGAIVKQSVGVGEDVVLGLGAVVLGDAPAGATLAGVPARPIDRTRRRSDDR
jgi:UDP-3-O-[3-hydroxymyristoyl] glucosamine N-acyltransferase